MIYKLMLLGAALAAFVAGWAAHVLYFELMPFVRLWLESRKPNYVAKPRMRESQIKDLGSEYGKLTLRRRFVMERQKDLN